MDRLRLSSSAQLTGAVVDPSSRYPLEIAVGEARRVYAGIDARKTAGFVDKVYAAFAYFQLRGWT